MVPSPTPGMVVPVLLLTLANPCPAAVSPDLKDPFAAEHTPCTEQASSDSSTQWFLDLIDPWAFDRRALIEIPRSNDVRKGRLAKVDERSR